MPDTHLVENQPPPLVDYDGYAIDAPLREALRREGGGWGEERVHAMGRTIGSAPFQKMVRDVQLYLPRLVTHDRFGHRVDEVEFHDSWHGLLAVAKQAGIHALPWIEPRPGAHVVRAAAHYLFHQGDAGPSCPIAMTFAVVPALKHEPDLAAEWTPRVLTLRHDPRFAPSGEKTGALFGMAMTEKQGGSDVRANSTKAVPIGGDAFELTGHKWFCSAPMCDAFLTLAYAPEGLTCFLVPRFRPDGSRNRFFIQRLKDKLGNKSNASSEIEYDRSWARRVGPPGRGVPTIIEMVQHTRLECIIGAASLMRAALTQALHHVSHRRAFQKKLIDQPLMRAVIADLALETEAATATMLRVARGFDEGGAFARLATPVAKYWLCKRVSPVVLEALECFGGAGYVEEGPMARLYREAPLNGIWEGSANVICLDVLRALQRDPESRDAFLAELDLAKGRDRHFDRALAEMRAQFDAMAKNEAGARLFVERLAILLQVALMLRHAPAPLAELFAATRLAGEAGRAFGAWPAGTKLDAAIERVAF